MSGKVAVVTGASSGIGEATARKLAGLGFTVYAAARRVERMAPLADAGIRPVMVDVTGDATGQPTRLRFRSRRDFLSRPNHRRRASSEISAHRQLPLQRLQPGIAKVAQFRPWRRSPCHQAGRSCCSSPAGSRPGPRQRRAQPPPKAPLRTRAAGGPPLPARSAIRPPQPKRSHGRRHRGPSTLRGCGNQLLRTLVSCTAILAAARARDLLRADLADLAYVTARLLAA